VEAKAGRALCALGLGLICAPVGVNALRGGWDLVARGVMVTGLAFLGVATMVAHEQRG
jgi:hypothetical protein